MTAAKLGGHDETSRLVQILNKGINTAPFRLLHADRIADLGGTVMAGAPSDVARLIVDEIEKWDKVIRAANIKAEQGIKAE